ncbi:MAG: signal peptidase I [Gemmatimonadaceae bacterium]|nr:signal peptidase I [Gemmatimonadaceae bacterium]
MRPPATRERRDEALRAANRGSSRLGSRAGGRGGGRGLGALWAALWRGSAAQGAGPRWRTVLLLALLFFALARVLLVEAVHVSSSSMTPGLMPGDYVLVSRVGYGSSVPFTNWRLPFARELARNQVLVFDWPPDPSQVYVKRVAGRPGDTVQVGGQPVVVPPGHSYVLGDKRDDSLDSRHWGLVPDTRVRGVPWFVYFSVTPAATPWWQRIRWERVGRAVQ